MGVASVCTGEIAAGDPAARADHGTARPGLEPGAAGSRGPVAPPGAGPDGTVSMSPPPVRVQRVGLDVGAAPLRRLTRSEYNFTVQELFREATLQPANGFAPDEVLFGFAAGLGVPPLLVDQYCEAAARLAAGAVRNLPGLLGCNVAATGEDACTRRFIDGFGGRAYRGPLADEQRAGLRALYRSSKAAHGFAKGQEIPSPRNASGCGVFRVGERCYSL